MERNSGLLFDSDGLLSHRAWLGIDIIDLASGSVTPIPWLEGKNIGKSGAFAPDGRLLLYHPNTNVFAADLENETIDIFHQVISNSWAMASAPTGDIYVAFGNRQVMERREIYRVVDMQTLELVLTVPYGEERAMAFDQQGFGYLALGDQTAGDGSFVLTLLLKILTYITATCHPSALAMHPLTGQIWWEDCGYFQAFDEKGNLVQVTRCPGCEDYRTCDHTRWCVLYNWLF